MIKPSREDDIRLIDYGEEDVTYMREFFTSTTLYGSAERSAGSLRSHLARFWLGTEWRLHARLWRPQKQPAVQQLGSLPHD